MQPDPRTWRPQAFGRRKPKQLLDPIIEPAWLGARILAHVTRGDVLLLDPDGVDLAEDQPEIAAELASIVGAEALVVDGYLTDQALRTGIGLDLQADATVGIGEHMTQLFLGNKAADYVGGRGQVSGRPAARPTSRVEAPASAPPVPIAFVTVDLLVLDDDILLDVPLLERKRLLESVVAQGERVRRTPFVREPAGTFIVSWRGLGFGGLAYKEANSRYHPGEANDDWSLIDMPRR